MGEAIRQHLDYRMDSPLTTPAPAPERFIAIPFNPSPTRAGVVSHIMRNIVANEVVFSDFTRACDERCYECEDCLRAMTTASRILSNPTAIIFEIWDSADEEARVPIGVVVLLAINAQEMHAHFCFFDGKLRNKASLLESIVEWVFAAPVPPRRITIEVPDYAHALARFGNRHLGFGGQFAYHGAGKAIQVEGIRKAAVRWRGVDRDVLVLGRIRDGA